MNEYIFEIGVRTHGGVYSHLREEIVRCRDCKHYKHSSWHRCDLYSIAHEVEPDGFCKWGERKEA